jgi:hypothetical protein
VSIEPIAIDDIELALRAAAVEIAFDRIKEAESDHLYVIQAGTDGPVKIGRSVCPGARLAQLQTGSPVRLHLLRTYCRQGHREHIMHRWLAPLHVAGEWFQRSSILILDEVMP